MIEQVTAYFLGLQKSICDNLAAVDGAAEFSIEQIHPPTGGLAQPRVLADGAHIEKAAVPVSYTHLTLPTTRTV